MSKQTHDPTSDPILDSQARERIVHGFDERRLFVEAGAGTGKTTALVGRLVETLGHGAARIDQIVAITFTDAAASELRARLRAKLDAVQHDDARPQAFKQRCLEARRNLDKGVISTIHGFASRVLSMFPTEAGLPFEFDVLDDIESRLIRDKRWRAFIASTFGAQERSEELERLLRIGLELDIEPKRLKPLFIELDAQWHDAQQILELPRQQVPKLDVSDVRRRLALLLDYRQLCTDEEDKLAVHMQQVVPAFVQELERFDQLERSAQIGLLRAGIGGPGRGGKGASWGGDAKVVKSAWDDVTAACVQQVGRLAQWYVIEMSALMATEVGQAAAHRHFVGSCTYDDLLVLVCRIVRDNAEVRQRLRETFTHLYVDEFQDTDSLQAELVELLTSDGEPNALALFTVGDPRQSIYRFRRAEPRLFSEVRERQGADSVVRLAANFRTQSGVIDWVNVVFGHAFGNQVGITTGELVASRAETSASVRVIGASADSDSVDLATEGTGKGKGGAKRKRGLAADVRAVECNEVAELCRRARDDGWPIGRDGEARGARFRDIAIVFPARTSLSRLRRSLEEFNVPYRIEGREKLWQTQEVADLLNIVRAVSDPLDSIAVVASLRSIAFACTDIDLIEWREAGHDWDYRKVDTVESLSNGSVPQAMATLLALHEQRHWLTVAELVERVIAVTDMFARVCAFDRPRDSWARIRYFQDLVRGWNHDSSTGLAGFVAWAGNRVSEDADAVATINPDSDDDAVRLMTVHSSKGLEFPIVFVVGMGSGKSPRETPKVIWGPTRSPEIALSTSVTTTGYETALKEHKAADAEEDVRLAYVACTRARDHLVVSLHTATDKSLAAALARSIEESAAANVEVFPVGRSADIPGVAAGEDETDLVDLLQRASVSETLSGTAAAKLFGAARAIEPRWHADPVAADAAKRFGSAVHMVMEHQDLDTDVDPSLVEGAATRFELLERRNDIAKSARLALTSPLVAEAAQSKHWKELDLLGSIDGLVVQGQADLVFERGDGLVIVDWKTDLVQDDAHANDLVGYYQWQLITYAWIVAAVLNRPVLQASICLISPSQESARILSVEDIDDRIGEYRESLGRWSSSGSMA